MLYTFSSKPDPCHYTTLLNVDALNLYLTLDLWQSDCSDLVSKWRGHTVVTTFLLRSHCQTCAGCLETIFYVSTGRHPGSSSTRHRRFPGQRETRETRRRLSACVRVRGAHFEHKFWQFWADLSWQLTTLLNTPFFQFTVCYSVVR